MVASSNWGSSLMTLHHGSMWDPQTLYPSSGVSGGNANSGAGQGVWVLPLAVGSGHVHSPCPEMHQPIHRVWWECPCYPLGLLMRKRVRQVDRAHDLGHD